MNLKSTPTNTKVTTTTTPTTITKTTGRVKTSIIPSAAPKKSGFLRNIVKEMLAIPKEITRRRMATENYNSNYNNINSTNTNSECCLQQQQQQQQPQKLQQKQELKHSQHASTQLKTQTTIAPALTKTTTTAVVEIPNDKRNFHDQILRCTTTTTGTTKFAVAASPSSGSSCCCCCGSKDKSLLVATVHGEEERLRKQPQQQKLGMNFPSDTNEKIATIEKLVHLKMLAANNVQIKVDTATTTATASRTSIPLAMTPLPANNKPATKATTTRILATNKNEKRLQQKSNNKQTGDIFLETQSTRNDRNKNKSKNSNNIGGINNTTTINRRSYIIINKPRISDDGDNDDDSVSIKNDGNKQNNDFNSSDSSIVMKLLQQTLEQLRYGKDTYLISKMCRTLLVMIMVTATALPCYAGRQDALSNCTFPARWEGSWFLSGYQQSIHIKGSQFSYRGKCAASDGNKYLIVDEKGCHRCLVIYEKHKNVLQYKESECEGDSMYLHQTNPSAMAMRSVLKQSGDHSRAGAHPNSNGHSRLSSSDQYIMRSNDDMNDCPSDFCKGRETLQNLCDQIPGDALLYSLFRESAEPVKCPLKGPFVFTYNRGHGECKSPVSNIDSCTEDSRLLLSFQACHDVQGTESTVEELTCLATWKDGNSRYLVGLVSHHHAISNEERYRCFVYEKISSLMGGPGITSSKDAEYKLAQSGDATCNGLDSAEVGSRIMSLRKPPPAERCDFPAWFKGPRHWHALMGNAVYNYHSNDGSMHIIKPNGYMETRALCEQINKQTSTEMMAVVHYTTGCQSGFMCMMFYRRDTHVIEIQTGKQASRLEDACAPDHFDINRMPYITLLANNPDPQICPLEGLYNLRGAIGPPHISARHKRNHNNNNNNKGHTGHGHHHLQHDFNAGSAGAGGINGGAGVGVSVGMGMGVSMNDGSIGSGGNAFGHKRRRNTVNIHNSAATDFSLWLNARDEGLPVRRRRHAAATGSDAASTVKEHVDVDDRSDAHDDKDDEEETNDKTVKIKLMRNIGATVNTIDSPTSSNNEDENDGFNNKKHNKHKHNHTATAAAGRATTELIIDDENPLSKLTTSKFNYNNNNNNNHSDNNKYYYDYHSNDGNGRKRKMNKKKTPITMTNNKLLYKQLKAPEAAAVTVTTKEVNTTKSKSLLATQSQLQEQQQHHPHQHQHQERLHQQQKNVFATSAGRAKAVANAADGAWTETTELETVDDDDGRIVSVVSDGGIASASRTASADVVGNKAISLLGSNRVTFVASGVQQRSRRDAPGCIANYKAQRQLWIGCTAPNLIDVRPQCNDDGDEEYSCHGSWAENGTIYIIARHKGSKHGVCISYRPLEGTQQAAAQLIVGDACYRGATPAAPDHPLVANLTVFGKCGDKSAARAVSANVWWTTLLAVMMLTRLLTHSHANTLKTTQSTTR